jgi:flavin reductase (DIM6/NTAB) family NADH-FMN oxidoreductase RutF
MLTAVQPVDLQTFRQKRSASADSGARGFPEALRRLPRGVSVITFGEREHFGLTATSVSSLSREPPTILVSVDLSAPLSREFLRSPFFGVSVLAAGHDALADRFSLGAPIMEEERQGDKIWVSPESGVPLLVDAVAAFDCERDDVMECHGHAIVVGSVRGVRAPGRSSALVYWRGTYNQLGWSEEEICRAVGVTPTRAASEPRC